MINSGVEDIVEMAVSELDAGRSVVIFPEGRRTDFGVYCSNETYGGYLESLKFHRGAAGVLLRSRKAVVPVILDYRPPVLGRNQRWYQTPSHICRVKMSLLEPFYTTSTSASNTDYALARREVTNRLEGLYRKELQAVGQRRAFCR